MDLKPCRDGAAERRPGTIGSFLFSRPESGEATVVIRSIERAAAQHIAAEKTDDP